MGEAAGANKAQNAFWDLEIYLKFSILVLCHLNDIHLLFLYTEKLDMTEINVI